MTLITDHWPLTTALVTFELLFVPHFTSF